MGVSFGTPGNAVISVSSGGVYAHVPVQVVHPPVVTTVTITPSPVEIALGGTQQLTATAYDQFGRQMTGGTRTWSSANSAIAGVSSTGVVTGAGPGNTTVQVTVDGVSATVPITVNKLNIALTGPNYTMMDGLYSWSVSATGGTGSYSYSWSVEWPYTAPGNLVPLGSGSTQSLWIDSSSDSYFIVWVTVTSGNQSSSTAIGVCNLIVGMSC